MVRKMGFQCQAVGEAQRSMVRATWPHCLKLLHGAHDLELAREWRARVPDGVLVLRLVTDDDEPLSELPRLVEAAILAFEGFQSVGGRIVLEVPINERFQTTHAEFAALAQASVPAAARIKAAGYTPGVLVTSEGNPPGPPVDPSPFGMGFWTQPAVLEALLSFRAMGAIWCPHGYSHPPDASDDAHHALRPAWVMANLPAPARLNYLYGECGCDGGTNQPNKKPGVGWRGYFDDRGQSAASKYAEWLRAFALGAAADPLCVGAAIFLSGWSDRRWESFDVGDEVDLRALLTADVPGPPIRWLAPTPPQEPPMSEDIVLSCPMRASHAAEGNYAPGPRPTTRGVVIHTTRGGASSVETEYVATLNWFTNPDAGVSAHLVIGAGRFSEACRSVHDAEVAHHAREHNATHLGLEIVQQTPATPIADFSYRAAAEACRKWAATYGFPLRRVMDARQPGLIGHEDTAAGKRDGKTDPGPLFDWPRFLALCQEGPTVPTTPTADALRTKVYALGEQIAQTAADWRAAGYPQTAEYCESQGYAVMKSMVTGKGEK